MEKIEDYTALLIDTGEGYSFADGKTCQYGEILKAIAVLSNANIRKVFYEMSNKQYQVSGMDNCERIPLDEGEMNHVPSDEDMLRYPRPEFMGEEHTVAYNLPGNIKTVIGKNVLKFLEQVVHLELCSIHRKFIDSPDGAVPYCFKDNNFEKEIEQILCDRTVNAPIMNAYLGKTEVSYIPSYVKDRIFKVYTIETLAEVIVIEISKVLESSIRYKKCPICNMLFIDGAKRGESRKYCDYHYDDGMCSDKAQKLNEENQPEIKKLYKKFYDKVRKYYDYNKERIDGQPWEVRLSDYQKELLDAGLSYEEHVRLLKEWFEKRKSEVKKK